MIRPLGILRVKGESDNTLSPQRSPRDLHWSLMVTTILATKAGASVWWAGQMVTLVSR